MFSVKRIFPLVEKDMLFKLRCLIFGEEIRKGDIRSYTSKTDLPSPPKRPLTAYLIFCKENRKDVLKDNPLVVRAPAQAKILAKQWGHLSPASKKIYEDIARQNTVLYGQAHKEFYESLTEEQREQLIQLKEQKKETRKMVRLKKALKESGIPKSPSSAYMIYLRSESKGKTIPSLPEFSKEIAAAWKNMPEDTKQYYIEQAEEDKKRYESQMMSWREKLVKEDQIDLLKFYDEGKQKKKRAVSSNRSTKSAARKARKPDE